MRANVPWRMIITIIIISKPNQNTKYRWTSVGGTGTLDQHVSPIFMTGWPTPGHDYYYYCLHSTLLCYWCERNNINNNVRVDRRRSRRRRVCVSWLLPESLNMHIRTPSTTCPCSMCATQFIYGNRTQHSRLDCRHSQPASHMRCEPSMYMLHTTYLNGGHCARWSSASAAGGLGGRLGRGAEFGFACIRLRGNRPFVRATVTRLRWRSVKSTTHTWWGLVWRSGWLAGWLARYSMISL